MLCYEVGYFGGVGNGQGWLTCKVLPDAELYGRLLDFRDTVLFRGQSSVPKAQPLVSKEEVLDSYSKLLAAWVDGNSEFRELEFKAAVQLAHTSNSPSFRPTNDPERVRVDLRTPAIDFFTGSIYVDSKGQICTNYSGGLWMGFHVTYPRVFSAEWTEWQSIDTGSYAEHGIYEQICQIAKLATVPLVLISGDRKVRTPIQYSPSLRDSIFAALRFSPWPLQLCESAKARSTSL